MNKKLKEKIPQTKILKQQQKAKSAINPSEETNKQQQKKKDN